MGKHNVAKKKVTRAVGFSPKKKNIINTGCTNDAILKGIDDNANKKKQGLKKPVKTNKVVKKTNSSPAAGAKDKTTPSAKKNQDVPKKVLEGTDDKAEKKVNNTHGFNKGVKTDYAKKRRRIGVNPEDPNAVFVMNLPVGATKDDVVKAFKHVGKVEDVGFVKRDGLATGNAFMKFSTLGDKQSVLAIEQTARSKLGGNLDQETVSFSGVGFSIDGRLLKVKDSVKKDDLVKDIAERKNSRSSRRLDLLTVGEVELHDSLLKKFTKGFIEKYRNNYKSKRKRVTDVNVHISPLRIRVGNAPKDVTKIIVKDTIVALLVNNDEGKALLNEHAMTIIKKGKNLLSKATTVPKQDDSGAPPRKKLGAQLLAFKSMGTVLIVHETRTDKEMKHDAAQRHKYVKGRFTGTIFVDFFCHEIAKFVIERLAFRQKVFSPTQERPLLAEFALEDMRKAEVHKLKKTKRDGLTKFKNRARNNPRGASYKKKN